MVEKGVYPLFYIKYLKINFFHILPKKIKNKFWIFKRNKVLMLAKVPLNDIKESIKHNLDENITKLENND